jgi:regulator of replication initiation timing
MSIPSSSSNSTDSADLNAGPDSANLNAGPNATPGSANLNDPSQIDTIPETATYDKNPESVSGDKSINIWRPDPSEFLAKCGLRKNEASVGPAAPAPEASPKEKLKQAAMWYYTSAASCFNDQGKMFEDNFNDFKQFANEVFVNQFGLTQNDANNLFSWSGESPPKQDSVESKAKEDPKTNKIDVDSDAMTRVKQEVRAELMTIPGVVTRKTGRFRPTEDTNLMPRVVDARMMKTFMRRSGFDVDYQPLGYQPLGLSMLLELAMPLGKPGSLEGNKFTVAPGRGRANEFLGSMSWHKGKGTGKTLVQAAVAMGLFNKTGSKVKFNLTGSPQELQNKFSAILDEMERYNLPLDKCTFSLPNDVMCPDIASLKKALQDTSHPLSRASNYGLTSGSGSQNVRNKLLMRIQSMENKIKNRSPGTEAPNVNMAHCTQAAILARAIPEGMTARQQEVFAQDLKNMNPETQKQVIQEAAANLAQNGSEEQKNQRLDDLLGVATAAVTDSNTARKLMGPDITGSMVAYESYAQNVTTIREIVAASPLEANLDNAEKGLMERAGIENMDPNSRDMLPTKTYVDAATLQTTQAIGQDYIKNLDKAATQLQEEIQKLKENISQTLEDPAKTSLLKSQLNDKEMDLITLQGSQKQALDSVTRSVQPLEYLSPREGSGFSVEEKIAALQAASKSNRKLVEEGGLKLPGLKSDLAKIKEDIAKVSTVDWMMGNTNYQVLQNKQAIIEKKIDLYENASINLENIQLCVKAAATPDGDEKNHLQEAIQEYAGNQKVRTHSDKPDTTYQPEIEIKVENPAKEDENKEIVITQYDKNKNPDDPDYRVEKRIPLDEENKPTSGETLEQAFHQAITSGNNAAITNSPGLWEAVQRIAVDSDKKNSQDLGGIKIYSQDFLEATDGLPTLAEAGKNQGTTNEHNAKLQAWQKVFAIPRTTTFSWSKNPIQKNTLGVESRTTRTTLATQEIEAAKETMNIKAQALKERASSIMQGPSQEVARSSLSSSATAYSNYSKPQPTSSK